MLQFRKAPYFRQALPIFACEAKSPNPITRHARHRAGDDGEFSRTGDQENLEGRSRIHQPLREDSQYLVADRCDHGRQMRTGSRTVPAVVDTTHALLVLVVAREVSMLAA